MATREADFEATTSRVRRIHARMCALNRRYRDERLAVPRRFRVRWLLGLVVYVPFLQFTLRVAGLYLPDWWDGVATLGFALVVVLGWCLLLSLFPARRRDSEQRDLNPDISVRGLCWGVAVPRECPPGVALSGLYTSPGQHQGGHLDGEVYSSASESQVHWCGSGFGGACRGSAVG